MYFINNKRLLFIFLFLIFSEILHAQDRHVFTKTVLPSPQSEFLVKHIAYPTGNFTGAPDITIPLFSITGKDIDYPLFLRHHIKNSKNTSVFGRGWSLQGTGLITRVIHGIDDLSDNGYAKGGEVNSMELNDTNKLKLLTNDIDAGPDLFYFNFNGYESKLMLSKDGEVLTDETLGLKFIIPSSQLGAWKVTDNQGYTYFFGEEKALEFLSKTGNYEGLVSSWYLSRIVSPMGDTLNFKYSSTIQKRQAENESGNFTKNYHHPLYEAEVEGSYNVPKLISIEIKNSTVSKHIGISYSNSPSLSEKLISSIWLYSNGLKHDDIVNGKSEILGGQNQIAEVKFFYNGNASPFDLEYVYHFDQNNHEPISSQKLSSSIAHGDHTINTIEYNDGKQERFLYTEHDLSGFADRYFRQYADLGVKLSEAIVSGAEDNYSTTYEYKRINGDASIMLASYDNYLTISSSRWVDRPLSKSQGLITQKHVGSIYDKFLGGYEVYYDEVNVSSSGRGKIKYKYTIPQIGESHEQGYYKEAFYSPIYSLDFSGGKLSEKILYKKVGQQYLTIERQKFNYTELNKPALRGINSIFYDYTEQKSPQNTLDKLYKKQLINNMSIDEISGYQTYNITVKNSILSNSIITKIDPERQIESKLSTEYSYDDSFLLKEELTTYPDLNQSKATYTYTKNYPDKAVFSEMIARNMLSYVVETSSYKKRNNKEVFFKTSGSITNYDLYDANHSRGYILPSSIYVWENTGEEAPSSDVPDISAENYKWLSSYVYDKEGSVSDIKHKGKPDQAFLSDYEFGSRVFVAYNATSDDIYYNGFESDNIEPSLSITAKYGDKCLVAEEFQVPFVPEDSEGYILSYYYYENNQWNYEQVDYTPTIKKGEAIDEVKVYPRKSHIQTSTYDEYGHKLSETDQNGYSIFFEYDSHGDLEIVRDNEANILEYYDRNRAQFPSDCNYDDTKPIEAIMMDSKVSVNFGYDVTSEVVANGGCGSLSFEWYIVAGNKTIPINIEHYESYYTFKANYCTSKIFVKCKVSDENGFYAPITVTKEVNIRVEDIKPSISIKSMTHGGSFTRFCSGDQLNFTAIPTNTCGSLSYQWVYSYNGQKLSSTSARAIFPYMGRGTIKCTVRDDFGNTASSATNIAPDKNCLN
ncbi:hypothetical protein [Fulvivirga sediminis]|uniref:RHS repeat protein n=1 Tax=Fulvivirga sediminis TaxID=2803949 RepID=A0A937F9E1_9BACT|nr:hypothetical protein [Fulvivirga sediminis]MBL3656700.1 hypothetical protein [Fulvivirga sediminis]